MYLPPPPSPHPAMISHLSLRSSPLAAHALLFWNTRVHGAFYSLLVLFLGLVHSQSRGSAPGRCEGASFIVQYGVIYRKPGETWLISFGFSTFGVSKPNNHDSVKPQTCDSAPSRLQPPPVCVSECVNA